MPFCVIALAGCSSNTIKQVNVTCPAPCEGGLCQIDRASPPPSGNYTQRDVALWLEGSLWPAYQQCIAVLDSMQGQP